MEYTKGEWEIAHYESGILEGVNFIRSADKQEVSICTISSTNESSEANAQPHSRRAADVRGVKTDRRKIRPLRDL